MKKIAIEWAYITGHAHIDILNKANGTLKTSNKQKLFSSIILSRSYFLKIQLDWIYLP